MQCQPSARQLAGQLSYQAAFFLREVDTQLQVPQVQRMAVQSVHKPKSTEP
jgi:hypothetical protein